MARKQYDNPQLFFVVTIKQEDLFSKLNANRPAPNPNRPNEKVVDEQIVIEVGANGLIYNGRPVSVKELDRNIKMAASVSKKTTVLLQCSLDSPHKFLVDALDVCNKHGLQNLSIFSM